MGDAAQPVGLTRIVAACTYKPGWEMRLLPSPGPGVWWPQPGVPFVLSVKYTTPDSNDPGRIIPIQHQFGVPVSCDNWPRWLLDRLLDCEHHEVMEFYTIGGVRPFYPDHGRGTETLHQDLYEIRERHAIA